MIARVVEVLREQGPAGVLRLALKTARHQLSALSPEARHRARRLRTFDERWGTETARTWEVSRLGLPEAVRHQAVRYQTTPLDNLPDLLRELVPDPGSTSFIDFGSGKGRVILTAAQLPFRRVIGVELSAELCAIARSNLEIMQRHGVLHAPVEVIHANVADFNPPRSDMVAYFYNPFGRDLMGLVAGRLDDIAQSGMRVVVLYVDPRHAELFSADRGWQTLRKGAMLILERRPGSAAPRAA